jgi:hypothetical protein
MVGRQRLDVDAVPAGVIEGPGDRMLDRVAGADVDVEAVAWTWPRARHSSTSSLFWA